MLDDKSSYDQKKIVVAGNGALDIYVQGKVVVNGPNVTVSSSDGMAEFRVEDPPITSGKKHRVDENIGDTVNASNLWIRHVPGGGGFNSIVALRQLEPDSSKLNLTYVDVSIPHISVMEGLRRQRIDRSYHFWRRGMRRNCYKSCCERRYGLCLFL